MAVPAWPRMSSVASISFASEGVVVKYQSSVVQNHLQPEEGDIMAQWIIKQNTDESTSVNPSLHGGSSADRAAQ